MARIYLDHQAATPLLPEVLDSMQPYLRERFGSPSSLHESGLWARDALAKAREQMAEFIGAQEPADILFTSDGTEAANLAIKGAAWANRAQGQHLIISAIEHPAVANSVAFLETQGFNCTRVAVDAQGRVDPARIQAAITDQTILISVHHANHDIGTLQPVAKIGRIAAERGITFHVDAENSAGWLPLDVQALGIRLLSFSPYRFYGPKGVGVLYRHRRARLTSLIHGGAQEDGRRAGAENVPAIVGAGVAAEIAARELTARQNHTSALQRQLGGLLSEKVTRLCWHGPPPGPDRISTQLNFSAAGIEGEGVMLMLDTQGIAVASGTSCVSKSLRVSPVLQAIGVDAPTALSAILVTLGKDNTPEEMQRFADAYARVVTKLRGMSPGWDSGAPSGA